MARGNRFGGSLLARLFLGYVAVTLVLTGAWLWSLSEPLTDAILRQQEQDLTAIARGVSLLESGSGPVPDEVLERLVAGTDLHLTIIAADGGVITDSESDAAAAEPLREQPEVVQALAGTVGSARRVSRTKRIEELHVAVPGSLDGRPIAVRVAQPIVKMQDVATRSRRVGLALMAVVLLVVSFIAVRAADEATKPVRDLSVAAKRMAEGDLAVDVPEMPSDLAELASALTVLRDQVRTRIEALDAERRTLSATLDGVGEAVLLIEGGIVRFANHGFSQLFRAPFGGPEGARVEATGLPASLAAKVRELITGSEPATVDLPPDPLGRSYRVSVSPVAGSGDPHRRYVVVISDVTERTKVDRVRRDFVANASHELKTPVAGIRLLADSTSTAASDGDVETAVAFARQISQEASRLQHLVSDLLDLSRLESVAPSETVTDVREALDRAVVSHQAAADRKGLSLVLDDSAIDGRDVFVVTDPTDVAIALDNLVDNAITYTERGTVTVSVSTDGDRVNLSVADTGPGIEPQHHDRIFERFYRVDSGRSREQGGTGLGLALVRHVAERVGGSVELESRPGAGSTFTIRLPRAL